MKIGLFNRNSAISFLDLAQAQPCLATVALPALYIVAVAVKQPPARKPLISAEYYKDHTLSALLLKKLHEIPATDDY